MAMKKSNIIFNLLTKGKAKTKNHDMIAKKNPRSTLVHCKYNKNYLQNLIYN